MVSTAATLILVIITVISAVGQYRRDRQRGIKIDYAKTLVTLALCIAITLAVAASLFIGIRFNQVMAGLILSMFCFVVGMTWLAAEIPRWRPPPAGAAGLRVGRRGAMITTGVCAVLAGVAAALTWNWGGV